MRRLDSWVGLPLLVFSAMLGTTAAGEKAQDAEGTAVSGREIFVREWVANDPRSHGGDGLGPVFNGSSCAACHNQGGIGGAGSFDENVTLLSAAFANFPQQAGVAAEARKAFGQQRERTKKRLAELVHPDFAKADTIVVHRFGGEGHENWRQRVTSGGFTGGGQVPNFMPQPSVPDLPTFQSSSFDPAVESLAEPVEVVSTVAFAGDGFVGVAPQLVQPLPNISFVQSSNNQSFPILNDMMQRLNRDKAGARSGTANSFGFENAVLRTSQRNTTALWGAGLLDRIKEKDIEALAAAQKEAGGRVSGRVHRLADGRIGRFGWKAQKASLYDFTMAACAVELGLEIPGEHQSTVPYDKDYEPAGLDLTKHEVDALVDYVAGLPQPRRLEPANDELGALLDRGEKHFAAVGCASCHVQDVGEVKGVFTDLLLHDLGPDLGSVGSYGVPNIPEPDPENVPVAGDGERDEKVAKSIPPTSQEWRTPPLWGLRDSAPYLHDGRARTLEQAIAFHGGEAAEARLKFAMLEPKERAETIAFLKSLVAPESVAGHR